MSNIPISDLNKRGLFSNFALCLKGHHCSITKFDNLGLCNILHLEMKFGNLYKKESFFIKFFDKSIVKINLNKKLLKIEIAYLTARNLKPACLWSLNLGYHNTQQYILNVSSKVKLQYFFHLEKIKTQNAFSCKLQNFLKGPSFHCQKFGDQKYLRSSRTS